MSTDADQVIDSSGDADRPTANVVVPAARHTNSAAEQTEEGPRKSAPEIAGEALKHAGESAEGRSKPAGESADTTRDARQRWKNRWRKLWAGGVATLVIGVAIGFFVNLLNSVTSPSTTPAPSVAATRNPGHLPGRLDVSTMATGQRFYAVPNFYYDQGCGRPCWLPLYQSSTEQSALVNDGWPCEFYGPNLSSEPSCTQPPAGRSPTELATAGDKNSGDRILVVCQIQWVAKGKAATTIHNDVGQGSHTWDMVAVPKSDISPDSPATDLRQVPSMPGYYEAYAPDMWLGDTGWHGIPC